MSISLIINADDFGLCPGVNFAVRDAHLQGLLTSATLMSNMPYAEQAAEIAGQMPNLGIGVHLNLTEGKPLTMGGNAEILVNADGLFARSANQLAVKSLFSSRFRAAIAAEFEAQIRWLIDKGIQPTHLDSHKHIHSFPGIYPIVCSLAGRYRIPAIRNVFEPRAVSFPPWPAPSKGGRQRAKLLRFMATVNRRQNADFIKTHQLYGVAHTGKIDLAFFETFAENASCGTAELMTHPGYRHGLDECKTRLVEQRVAEQEALCSGLIKQMLNNAGVRLMHYGQL